MTDNAMRLRCTKCGHTWASDIRLPMEITRWVKRCRATRCPECDADQRFIMIDASNKPKAPDAAQDR